MNRGRSRPADDVLVCADVLGAFGVSAADVEGAETDVAGIDGTSAGRESRDADRSLEAALSGTLDDARDRTAVLRRTICRSRRGIDCAARYATSDAERELAAAFEALGWSFALEERSDGIDLRATDPGGRTRETTFRYPETPLGTDNLPALLCAITDRLLGGTDAEFVLLSAGVDRWRAALVETAELERVRETYGDRAAAFDRPLLPEYGAAAYVPGGGDGETGVEGERRGGPWPAWALERAERRSESAASAPRSADRGSPDAGDGSVASLIEEAEPAESTGETRATSAPSTEAGDLEIVGGSPTVSRSRAGVGGERPDSGERDGRGRPDRERADREADREVPDGTSGADENGGPNATDGVGDAHERDVREGADEADEIDTDGFGTLSGSSKTARVSNDSFGAGVDGGDEDDRYRALGAALGTGRNVSVEGLLDDETFLPELPATESRRTRIEFEESFDPDAVPEARAAAEESGFVWVDSGSLETTRVSNGS